MEALESSSNLSPERDSDTTNAFSVGPRLRYPQPEILLVDMAEKDKQALVAEGYNVTSGSFGQPYKVEMSDGYKPLIPNGDLPRNAAEFDIVIIDLAMDRILDEPGAEKLTSPGTDDIWAHCGEGIIDPRPRLMREFRTYFDRILARGGVVILFAAPRHKQQLIWGRLERDTYYELTRATHLDIKKWNLDLDNWGLLSVLDRVKVADDSGRSIKVCDGYIISGVLAKHALNASFSCTLHPYGTEGEKWIRFAENKYAEPVALLLAAHSAQDPQPWGSVFILPQIANRPEFLVSLVSSVLPYSHPVLFPYLEGAKWVERKEYEIPGVMDRKVEIDRVRTESEARISALEQEIHAEREKFGYLHELIRGTGDTLVRAVKTALEVLGFQDVVDIDLEREQTGDTGPKREDLQIRDFSPLLLIEIKGVVGVGKESEKLQVWKYMTPKMKQLNRTDIHGLSIVNHQREVPALERNNDAPFQDDVVTNAVEHDIGLLTTWDLFRLVRSFQNNGWAHEHIRELFYHSGRIEPVPAHYQYIGRIAGFIETIGVVGVQIEVGSIRRGDRVAFDMPVVFEEHIADSLEVRNQPVEEAGAGQMVGIKTSLTKEQARNGVKVYVVKV
jgi:hypothetical protein